jgi:hypothetical protein
LPQIVVSAYLFVRKARPAPTGVWTSLLTTNDILATIPFALRAYETPGPELFRETIFFREKV